MRKFTGEKELLLIPAKWNEQYHSMNTELPTSDDYILYEIKTFLNCKLLGPKRYQLFFLSLSFIRYMKEYRPEIIVVDSEPYSLLALQVAIIRRILFPNSLFIVHSSQNIFKKYPFPFYLFELFVLNQVTAIFARTEEIKDVLKKKRSNICIYVLPHGVDRTYFNCEDKSNLRFRGYNRCLKIGYVGSLVKHKGVNILIDAVEKMKHPFQLTIVGNGPEKDFLKHIASLSNEGSLIKFLDTVPNSELPNLLKSFDVLVVPSITLPNWKEQFGRIIIEAMACGIPIIGSDCGSIPEVIGDGGLIFKENDTKQLTIYLDIFASDQELLYKLSLQALERVKQFYSWETVTNKIYSIYQFLLSN